MSRLTDLISHAKAKDYQLGVDLEREFKVLTSRLAFGLNFERHRPEAVELAQCPIRKGNKVRVMPKRGSLEKGDQRLWVVKRIQKTGNEHVAKLKLYEHEVAESLEVNTDDLVVVAEFRDLLYPGLINTCTINSGGDKPYHTVINGENYLVLKTLSYTHRGKVDVIYIDPPYNTGAKDWKYNNDFVDREDAYRHSKWLAFMERRLNIAKDLLNPKDSVLIVTVDEKEYLRLGLLLEQTFPGQRIQMVSTQINPKGSARGKEFYRVDEYIYFVYFGTAVVQDVMIPGLCITKSESENEDEIGNEKINKAVSEKLPPVRWASLLRSGSGAQREESHLKFYPILVDTNTGKIVKADDPLPIDKHPEDYFVPDGLTAVWPLRQNGSEGRWQLNLVAFRALLAKNYVKIGSINQKSKKVTFYYLMEGQRKKLESGELVVVGEDKFGGLIVDYSSREGVSGRPKTQWSSKAHSATEHGSSLLRKIIPGRKFPYPKSLYAVEDALRFFVANKPDALILDYYAGSGTTVHAVMRLNRQDGGCRQCIAVTNNEVAADEQDDLRKKGLRPGDPEWERWGVYDYFTMPRIKAAITGETPDGAPISGDYIGKDVFPMAIGFEENAAFFKLTYESPVAITHNIAFNHVAPLMWMRASSKGRIINTLPSQGWEVVDRYGLLNDLDYATAFCREVEQAKDVRVVFIVTNDDLRFQSVAQRLPDSVEAIRLYESYLSNFEFMSGE